MIINAEPGQVINLGKVGSHLQTTIRFNLIGFLDSVETIPDTATVGLLFEIPNPLNPSDDYLIRKISSKSWTEVVANNYIYEWIITSDETEIPGPGRCELVLFEYENDESPRLVTTYYEVKVTKSVYDFVGNSPRTNLAYTNWLEQLIKANEKLQYLYADGEYVEEIPQENLVTVTQSGGFPNLHFKIPRPPRLKIKTIFNSLSEMLSAIFGADYEKYDLVVVKNDGAEGTYNGAIYSRFIDFTGTPNYQGAINILPASANINYFYLLYQDDVQKGFQGGDIVRYNGTNWEVALRYIFGITGDRGPQGYKGDSLDHLSIEGNPNNFHFYAYIKTYPGETLTKVEVDGNSFISYLNDAYTNASNAASSATNANQSALTADDAKRTAENARDIANQHKIAAATSASSASTNAELALGYKNAAQSSAENAASSATNAEGFATQAKDYRDETQGYYNKMPYIENRYWYVWSVSEGRYINTNIIAEGKNFTVSGHVNSVSELPSGVQIGTAYAVGASIPYDVYIYYQNGWNNMGPLGGSTVSLDLVNNRIVIL